MSPSMKSQTLPEPKTANREPGTPVLVLISECGSPPRLGLRLTTPVLAA
jgi:hypothetical protein